MYNLQTCVFNGAFGKKYVHETIQTYFSSLKTDILELIYFVIHMICYVLLRSESKYTDVMQYNLTYHHCIPYLSPKHKVKTQRYGEKIGPNVDICLI